MIGFATRDDITWVRKPRTPEEKRENVTGSVQAKKGFFDVRLPADVGDEFHVPRASGGDPLVYIVGEIHPHEHGTNLDHLEVVWAKPSSRLPAGDTYHIHGQAGAVGPGSVASGNTFIQVKDVNVQAIVDFLEPLIPHLKAKASTAEEYVALGNTMGALDAARGGDGGKAVERLKAAGQWVFSVATQIATGLATDAIKAMVLAS